MNGRRNDPVFFKLRGKAIGRVLHARKDEHLIPVVVDNEVAQQFALALFGNAPGFLRDKRAFLIAGNLDRDGVCEEGIREGADLRRERGREHQGLALGGHELDHALDVVDKAHVEHAVGLVEHEKFDAGQVHVELAGVIE